MANSPPRKIDNLDVGELSDDLPVDVDEVTECDGGSECLRETPVSSPPPGDDPITETYFPYTTVKTFDKWILQQCKECGGLAWLHNARADYGMPDKR